MHDERTEEEKRADQAAQDAMQLIEVDELGRAIIPPKPKAGPINLSTMGTVRYEAADGMFSPTELAALREIIKHFSCDFLPEGHWRAMAAACKAALPATTKLPVVDTEKK
jgi:hypothetical protein